MPWLVFEYMEHGDLSEILRANSGIFSQTPPSDSAAVKEGTGPPKVGLAEMWSFAKQVAYGMEYIVSMHLTHRDLAARNCLIGKGLTLKISDFGLTRDVYESDYYKMSDHNVLPIRWMAPETITHGKFSEMSDAWSYGILLWEIFTFGKRPYYYMSNEQVRGRVPEGLRMQTPEGCPQQMSQLMTHCWKFQPHDRWTFHQIVQYLSTIKEEDIVRHESDHSIIQPHPYLEVVMMESASDG